MVPDTESIKRDLTTFQFKELFVQKLGWDNLREQPLVITCKGETQNYILRPLVEKRGVKVYICDPDAQGRVPDDTHLRQIEREVTKYAYEHLIIYVDAAREQQVWQWVKREQGKPLAPRVNKLRKGQSADLLAQKVQNLAISF